MSDFVWKNSKERGISGRRRIDSNERGGSSKRMLGCSRNEYICPHCGGQKFFLKHGLYECTKCKKCFKKEELN